MKRFVGTKALPVEWDWFGRAAQASLGFITRARDAYCLQALASSMRCPIHYVTLFKKRFRFIRCT